MFVFHNVQNWTVMPQEQMLEKATRKLSYMVMLAPKCCSSTVTESFRENFQACAPDFSWTEVAVSAEKSKGQQLGHFKNRKIYIFFKSTDIRKVLEFVQKHITQLALAEQMPEIKKPLSVEL